MDTITTLDGKVWKKKEILKLMLEDSFYYGYLGENSLSSSAIKQMYKAGTWNYEPVKESTALRQGKLIHLLTLEPHRLKELIFTGGTRASKTYKSLSNFSDITYTLKELEKCQVVADSVLNDFEAFECMESSLFEVPEIKEIEGFAVRGKADILGVDFIADLKTTSDINKIDDSFNHWNYDIQGALYCDLFNVDRFIIIWVDKTTLEVKTVEYGAETLQIGREKYLQSISKFKNK